jgi:hypothetical protein
MDPLLVTAHIRGAFVPPPPFLDALLGWAVATRDDLPPAFIGVRDLDIPVQLSDCGRVYLCSAPQWSAEWHDKRHINRRYPVQEAMLLGGPKLRRIDERAGPQKAYHLPQETAHAVGDVVQWWCVGDREAILPLLQLVWYLGKRRAVGLGKVVRWTAEPCEPWEGFPVLRDGYPLRPLPMDWPEVAEDSDVGMHVLRPPYWQHQKEEPCWTMTEW